jgi:autotransporter-associated beta strand protein
VRCAALALLACGLLGVAQAQTTWMYTNASGLWSSSESWTNGLAPTGGATNYTLIFTNKATAMVNVTNNIADGSLNFLLNQLIFTNAATNMTVFGGTGTSLVFAANGVQNPQLRQESGKTLTFNHRLVLSNDMTFAGAGTGAVALNNNVAGVGSLTLNGAYQLTLASSNSYSGGTLLQRGTLQINNVNALGTGVLTLNGGTFQTSTTLAPTNNVVIGGNFTFGGSQLLTLGGTVDAGTGYTWTNSNTKTVTISGAITNSGGVTVAGTSTAAGAGSLLVFRGVNTYDGPTTINGSALMFGHASALPVNSLLTVNTGGALAVTNSASPYTSVNGWMTSGRIATNGALGVFALTYSTGTEGVDFTSQNNSYSNFSLGAVTTVNYGGTITPANNTYRLGGGGGTLLITNQLALTGSREVVINNLGGNGTVTLSGSNDYTGLTTIINSYTGSGAPANISNSFAFGTSSVIFTNAVNTAANYPSINFNGGAGSLVISNAITIDTSTPSGRMRLVSVTGSNILTGPLTLKSVPGGGSAGFEGSGLGANGSWTILGDIDGTLLNGGGMYLSGTGVGAGGYVLGNVDLGANGIMMERGGGTRAEWSIGAPGKTYVWRNIQVNGILHLLVSDVLPTNSYLNSTHNGDMVIDLNGTTQQVAYISTATYTGNLITNYSATPAALSIAGAANNYGIFTGTIADGPGGGTISLALGGGTMVLSGSNTYSGGTTVTNGAMLIVSSTNSFGTGSLVSDAVSGLGTTTALDQNFLNWVTNKTAAVPGVLLLGGNSANALTFGGSLSNSFLGAAGGTYAYSGSATWADSTVRLGGGSSNLTYASALGAGTNLLVGPVGGHALSTVILTNAANNFDGGTLIQSGTLQLGTTGAGATLLGTGAVTNNSVLAFRFGSTGSALYSNSISGSGLLTLASTAIIYLSGSNSYTGGTYLNSGTARLAVGSSNAAGTGPLYFITSGAALSVTGTVAQTLDNSLVFSNNATLGNGTDSGLLTLTGTADLAGAARTLTISSPVTLAGTIANGGLTKAGSSTLVLGGSNTYSLGTILTAGTLSIGAYTNLPATGPVTFSGGILQLTGTTINNLDPYTVNWGTFNGGFDIASAAHTLTIGTNISGAGISTKNGPGTLLLTGTNLYTGSSVLNTGALILQGNGVLSNTAGATLSVGNAAGSKAVLVVQDNARLSYAAANGVMYVGNTGAGAAGAVYQSDNSSVNIDGLTLSRAGSTYGYYALSNGTLTVAGAGGNSRLRIGEAGGSTNGIGVFYMLGGSMNVGTGGTFNNNGFDIAGGNGNGTNCIGVVYIAGGILSNSFANNIPITLVKGTVSNRAEMTVDGTALVTARTLNLGSGGTGTGILNLNGGTLAVSNITANAASANFVNFDGGTLQAIPRAASVFMGAAAQVYVYAGGATIDSDTNNITINAGLLAPLGNGITGISVTNFGSGYVGAPYVQITGGGGSNATAIAQFDPLSQTVTNILITSPGWGYVSEPTITLLGGGGTSAAATGTFSAVSGGGLTKLGSGTLTLAGSNTFGGGIDLQQGGLLFSTSNALPASVASLLVPFATSVGVGYPLDQAFINTISNQSAGTVALGADSSNPLDFTGLTNVSFGALGGPWTHSGSITPLDTTYRLGGGGGTLVVATVLTDQVAGATGLLAFGSGSGGIVVLAATNTYTGNTTLVGGELSMGSYSNLPLASSLVFSGGILQVTGTAVSNLNPYTVNWGSFDGGFDVASNGFAFTVTTNIAGPGSLTKLGSGTLVLATNNAYAGTTLINGGTLQVGAGGTTGSLGLGNVTNNANLAFRRSDTYTVANLIVGTGSVHLVGNGTFTPGVSFNLPATGRLVLGETNGTVGNLDLGNASELVGSLVVSNHNLTTASIIIIGANQSLTVAGLFQVGAGVAVVGNTFTTKLLVSGAGSLIVTNPGGTIQFGNSNGNIKDVHNLTTVDMSALGTFTANLGSSGTFRLGSLTGETGIASNLTTFATNTTITAGTIRIDHQGASAGADTVRLGAGTNIINANTINVGVGDIRAHNTFLQFAGNTGTVNIRAADGVGAANLTIGVRRGSGTISNIVDFTGHVADLNLNLLDVGGNGGGNVSGGSPVYGSFASDAGTTLVTTVRVGSMQNTTTNGQATGVITFGGGLVQVGAGGITLATNFSTLTNTRLNGTLNISGGTVTVGTNAAGNSLTLTAGTGINNATVNLTGGTFTLGGHVAMGAAGGANAATVTVAGATFDLTGHNLGSGAQPIAANFQSGTVLNLGELNGGAPLVKTTGGTLVLAGANGYTGGTLVNAGTLVASNAQALGGGPVAITNALLRLAQPLTIGGNLTGNAGPSLTSGRPGRCSASIRAAPAPLPAA